jgi:hypothetical protein
MTILVFFQAQLNFLIYTLSKVSMLYDTSIKDKETKREIDIRVGKSYGIFEILKQGTIGSSRMEVVEYSKLFTKIMSQRKQAVFANLSIRPNGILVIINVRLSNYSWVIPYHYLSIFKTNLLVIHGQGEYLKLKISGDQNKKVIDKILERKNLLFTASQNPNMG